MRKKICIVIHRYGTKIFSDIENYCRLYAEKLSKLYDIEVLTTCAIDNQTWDNHYTQGESEINGVRVRRFWVDFQRNKKNFTELTSRILSNSTHTIEESHSWVLAQGPVSSQLIDYIKDNRDSFDLFIFMTYSYYHTVLGLPIVKDKAILVPFAHKEPTIHLKSYEKIFTSSKGIIFNSEEEMVLIQNLFKTKDIPSILTGLGVDVPTKKEVDGKEKKYKLNFPFVLYLGEVAEAKGCDKLIEYFRQYKRQNRNNLKLVMVGKELSKTPKDKNIIFIPFLHDEEKYAVMHKSSFLAIPSPCECLSIPLLEAFALGKPVLVSGHNDSLKSHCIKSDGGLFFYSEVDFLECLDLLYNNTDLCDALGKNGEKYILENFQWNSILSKLNKFIGQLS